VCWGESSSFRNEMNVIPTYVQRFDEIQTKKDKNDCGDGRTREP